MQEQSEQPFAPKKSLFKRILKGVLWTVLGLVVLLALAIGFFHLPVGKNIIRGLIEDGIAQRFDGQVTLTEFDWALFSDIQLKGLRIATPAGEEVIGVDTVDIALDWGSLIGKPTLETAAIKGVRVNIENFEDGTNTLKRMQRPVPAKLIDLAVKSLTVTDLEVFIKNPGDASLSIHKGALAASMDLHLLSDGGLDFALTDFSAEVVTIAPRTASGIRVVEEGGVGPAWRGGTRATFPVRVSGNAKIGWPGAFTNSDEGPRPPSPLPNLVAVGFAPTGGPILVESPDRRLAQAIMTLPLSLPDIKATLEDETLRLDVGALRLGPLHTEAVTLRTSLTRALEAEPFDPTALDVDLEIRGMRLVAEELNRMSAAPSSGDSAPPLLLADLEAELSAKGPLKALVLTGDASWGPANFQVKGAADLSNSFLPVWEITFTGTDIAPKSILAIPNAPDVAAHFELWLQGRGIFPPDADIQTRLDMSGISVNGDEVDTLTLAASIVGEKISISKLEVQVFGQSLIVTGEADRVTRTFKATVESQLDITKALSATTIAELLPSPLPRGSGTLSLDLAVDGRLSEAALLAIEEGARSQRPPVLTNMPFDALNVHGKVRIDDLMFNTLKVGSLAFDIDLQGEGGIPSGPLHLLVKNIALETDGRTMLVDRVELNADVAKKTGVFTVAASSASEKLDLTGSGELTVDPEARTSLLLLKTLNVRRGGFDLALKEPVKLSLSAEGGQLEPLRLAVAGGSLVVDGDVRVKPAEGDTPATIQSFVIDLRLDGIDTGRLAAALGPKGRALARMPARLDGYVRASGSPTAPNADFHLTARTRAKGKLPAMTAELDGHVSTPGANGRLAVRPSSAPSKRPWFDAAFDLPVLWPTQPNEKPRLKPSGRISIKASLLERRLAQWGALLGLDGLDGEVEFDVDLHGTPARPKGSWGLAVASKSLLLPGKTTPLAPFDLALRGALSPSSGRGVEHTGMIELKTESKPLTNAEWRGNFAVSPLLLPLGAPLPKWEISGDLNQNLGPLLAWLRPLLPPDARSTQVDGKHTGTFKAHGRGADLYVDNTTVLSLQKVTGPAALDQLVGLWPLSIKTAVNIDDNGLTLRQQTVLDGDRGGAELSRTELNVGLPARGFLRTIGALARKKTLPDLPIAAFFEVPTRTPAELSRLLGLPVAMQQDLDAVGGQLGGRFDIKGRTSDPIIEGNLGLLGFKTLGGSLGKLALTAKTTDALLEFGFTAGPSERPADQLVTTIQVPRLPAALKLLDAKKPIPIKVAMSGKGTELRDLTPAHPMLAALPPIVGRVVADITGDLGLQPGHVSIDALTGGLGIEGLGFPLPNTTRAFKEGRLALAVSPTRVTLETFELHESDQHREDRWLKMAGGFDFGSGALDLRVTSLDFLMGGLGPASPDGELDLDLKVTAQNLLNGPILAELSFEHLDLDAPDRFVRAHHAQILSHGDVYDPALLNDAMPAAGVLPVPKSLVPPIPEDLDLKVAIIFPRPGRVGVFPLDMDILGRLDATVQDGTVDLRGRLDVTRGTLGAMGWEFIFEEGAITADGPLDTAKMELTFGLTPVAAAQRDTTVNGWHEGKAFITARATLAKGLETIFSGVAGPNVLDMATLVNTGRTRLWGAPDMPSSSTVRFGDRDQGLVNTFIATNIGNFIFMDRTIGWSDSLVRHERYGEIEWFDMQRFVPGSDTRVAMKGRPLGMGVNQLELTYDWLLINKARSVAGFGPRLGVDARLGLGFFWEWSSPD